MITNLLGIPYVAGGSSFDALDCFGVVELWYQHVLGIEVEDRSAHPPTNGGLQDGFQSASEWEAIDTPEDHCLVLMQAGKRKQGHIGVFYRKHVIHSDRKANSCVCQSVNDRSVKPYITGYLRHK